MSDTKNEFTLRGQYEYKKTSCEDRCIDFNFSFEEYSVFWALRHTELCFYTDQPMTTSKERGKPLPDTYATMERISNSSPYTPSNTVWCQNIVNNHKANYVENGQPVKGKDSKVCGIVARIEKVLNNPKTMARKLKPYEDAYKALEVINKTLAEDNLEAMRKQTKTMLEERDKATLQNHFFQEVLFAEHYVTLSKGFMQDQKLLELTIGEAKKMIVRCTKDMITGEVFDRLEDKELFVINNSLPVTKHNVKVVTLNTKTSLNSLLNGSTLAKVAMSLHKLEQEG